MTRRQREVAATVLRSAGWAAGLVVVVLATAAVAMTVMAGVYLGARAITGSDGWGFLISVAVVVWVLAFVGRVSYLLDR